MTTARIPWIHPASFHWVPSKFRQFSGWLVGCSVLKWSFCSRGIDRQGRAREEGAPTGSELAALPVQEVRWEDSHESWPYVCPGTIDFAGRQVRESICHLQCSLSQE